MGVLNVEMKKGLKVRVEGHLELGDLSSPMISSFGRIVEPPHHPRSKYVKVQLEHGPEKEHQVCMVPVANVYWTSQKREFASDIRK